MPCFVYIHTSKVTGKSYIGICSRPVAIRFREHCQAALRRGSQGKFHRAIRKHGSDTWVSETLHEVATWEEAQRLEQVEIAARDTHAAGYNMTAGGEGSLGLPMTPENRERLAGEFRQRWADPEYRARMERLNVGFRHDDTSRSKRSARLKGRACTWAHKVSAARTGRTYGPQSAETQERKRAKLNQAWIVTHPDGRDEEVIGLKTWCLERGLTYTSMAAVARGAANQHRGFVVRKADPVKH